jgi:hypothetical protein
VLWQSGLLASRDLPIEPNDVLRFLEQPDTYAAICLQDGTPQGYVVCCKRYMENQIPELFILQAVGDGGKAWVTEGWARIHELAARLGCVRIGVMLPFDRCGVLVRRFGFEQVGVYCTAFVRGDLRH